MSADSTSSDSNFTPAPLDQEAVDWLILRDRGFTAKQRTDFARWLRADARHEAAFAAIEETWIVLARAPAPLPELAEAPSRRRSPWTAGRLGLAAAGLAACVGIAWILFDRAPDPNDTYTLAASSGLGEFRNIELPDGSTIRLNTDSAVDLAFTHGLRRVNLTRGEAYFTVAKSATRPFVVNAASVRMHAVGTAFNVRLRPETIEILVSEGQVQVNPLAKDDVPLHSPTGPDAPLLVAGERATLRITSEPGQSAPGIARTSVAALPQEEIEQALAWQEQHLLFTAQPLSEIVAEFNHYNRHQLTIGDPRLASKCFGGAFLARDYRAFVRGLQENFGVIAEDRGNQTILRLAP